MASQTDPCTMIYRSKFCLNLASLSDGEMNTCTFRLINFYAFLTASLYMKPFPNGSTHDFEFAPGARVDPNEKKGKEEND